MEPNNSGLFAEIREKLVERRKIREKDNKHEQKLFSPIAISIKESNIVIPIDEAQ
jgi:hypothetical protein